MSVTKGGYNNSSPFALSEEHDKIYKVEATTLLPASTPVEAAAKTDAIVVLNQKFSTNIAFDANHVPAVTVDTDQYEEVVMKFTDVYPVIGAGGGGGGGNYENSSPEIGVAADGSGSAARDLAVPHYGPKMGSGKIELIVTVSTLDPTSGSTTWSDSGKNKPSIKFNATKAKMDIVIPKELFDDTIITVAADITIPKGSTYFRDYFPAAT